MGALGDKSWGDNCLDDSIYSFPVCVRQAEALIGLLQPFIECAAVGMVVDRPAIKGQHIITGAVRRVGQPTAGVKNLQDCFCILS